MTNGISDTILRLPELADRWDIEMATLRDPRWRRRIGLPVIKIGGKLVGVRADDVLAIEERGREQMIAWLSRA